MSRWWTRAWQLGAVALLLAVGYLTLHRDDGAVTAQRLGLPFPTVMAHRGASYLAPEETAWAYRVAKLVGADYLEADIQRSKDGVLIALHDDTLLRTTNVATVFPDRAQQPVSEFTWEELSRLDAGSWFNAKFPDRARPEFASARILRLDELCDIALCFGQAEWSVPGNQGTRALSRHRVGADSPARAAWLSVAKPPRQAGVSVVFSRQPAPLQTARAHDPARLSARRRDGAPGWLCDLGRTSARACPGHRAGRLLRVSMAHKASARSGSGGASLHAQPGLAAAAGTLVWGGRGVYRPLRAGTDGVRTALARGCCGAVARGCCFIAWAVRARCGAWKA
jgi:hypothetical protein